MYRMYDVYVYLFLFCIHVVVDVDNFFVLCYFPQSCLVVVCYGFCRLSISIIMSCFDKLRFCCFSLSYFISSLLMVGESPCKALYCTVLYCTVLYCLQSQQIVSINSQLRSQVYLKGICNVIEIKATGLYCACLYSYLLGSNLMLL
jgi:hypothetical protein